MRAMDKCDHVASSFAKRSLLSSAILAKASVETTEVTSETTQIECHGGLGAGFMSSEYTLGTRIRLSALGKARCPRLAKKTGTLVGRSIYVNSVVVLFDGNKTSSTIHLGYLEVLKDHSLEMS
jgi:hypothetical protein